MTNVAGRGFGAGLLLITACVWGCRESGPAKGVSPGGSSTAPPQSPAAELFTNVSLETGLRFEHFIGATGEYYYPEIMGAGCAFLDFDNDGDLDVYAVQGAMLGPGGTRAELVFPYQGSWPPRNSLFRNDLQVRADGTRTLRFVDVSEAAGVGDQGYGQGVAAGDYDNDGNTDLYLANFGSNVLYRNRGDGTFEDVTDRAGVDDERYSSSAAFLDYDRDGSLDLFVVNYVEFKVEQNLKCFGFSTEREYCGPNSFPPLPDRLFRNNGDGTFTNVTEEAGIDAAYGSGIGVVMGDFDADGWIDVYVANDGNANQLWMNQGDGTFVDTALMAGAALDGQGLAEAGMGVAAADFDFDEDEDIFITHLREETNTLYVNDGQGVFVDATDAFNLGAPSLGFTGFGMGWFDFDNDGRLDLFIANGDVKRCEPPNLPFPYRMLNQLFRQTEAGKFLEISRQGGSGLALLESSRGAAFGDVDLDGDIDVLVGNLNGPLHLLQNRTGQEQDWIMLHLVGERSNRDAIGARVGLLREGRPTLWRRVHTAESCYSASDKRVHFGLGKDRLPHRVQVHWPGGLIEEWADLPINALSMLGEGKGKRIAP